MMYYCLIDVFMAHSTLVCLQNISNYIISRELFTLYSHGITHKDNKSSHLLLEFVEEVHQERQQLHRRLLKVWMFHGLHFCPWIASTKYVDILLEVIFL